MKLKILGALAQVTGSASLLEYQGIQILIDFGATQGELPLVDIDPFEDIDVTRLKAVFLTHAHLDHCGLIPLLYKKGYEGPVITTKVTSEIAPLVMEDAIHIGSTIHTVDDLRKIHWYSPDTRSDFDWQKEFPLTTSGISYYFQPNAHILGSVSIGICWNDLNTGKRKEILFSGDIGSNTEDQFVSPLNNTLYMPKSNIDYLVCESTYGDRKREAESNSYEKRIQQLQNLLKENILSHPSTLFFPSFSLHRTQELILDLYIAMKLLQKSGFKPRDFPRISVDSLLANKLSLIYKKRLPDFLGNTFGKYKNIRRELLELLEINDERAFHEFCYKFFGYSTEELQKSTKGKKKVVYQSYYEEDFFVLGVFGVPMTEERKYPNIDKPLIYISSSGMMSDGPMKKWLPVIITKPTTTIAVTGYLAEGTIGEKLISMKENPSESSFLRFGEELYTSEDIKCNISILSGYSGHADQGELIDYVTANVSKKRTVFLNHGNDVMRQTLKNEIISLNNTQIEVLIAPRKMDWTSL